MTPSEMRRAFLHERAAFAARFPRVHGAGLSLLNQPCSIGGRCGERDLGWADTTNNRVFLLDRVLTLPTNRIIGLIRHELGHLSDARVTQPGAEQRADDIAEMVTGQPIRYDAKDIQTIGAGKYPRPLYLHR